jgi:hypothetical protein
MTGWALRNLLTCHVFWPLVILPLYLARSFNLEKSGPSKGVLAPLPQDHSARTAVIGLLIVMLIVLLGIALPKTVRLFAPPRHEAAPGPIPGPEAKVLLPAPYDSVKDRSEQNRHVATQADSPNARKAEVEKILGGKSDVKEVKVGEKTLKVGDTALISKWEWVDVMNLTPVKSANSTFVFKERGWFDSCGVDDGGTIKILGFTDDKARALVEYTTPRGAEAAGTKAPSGIQYFITVRRFAQLKT